MSYKRKIKDKRILEKLSKSNCAWYYPKKQRYVKIIWSSTPGYTKWLKRISNKKYRKTFDVGNYSAYKRLYDYRWELY